jgi:hypothetical protein
MGVKHGKQPVDLHIEELVLHGFSPGDRLRIVDAIEQELARLAGREGARWAADQIASRNVAEMDCGEFRLEPGWKPRDAGRHIAQAVGRGLMPESANSPSRTGARQQRGSNR